MQCSDGLTKLIMSSRFSISIILCKIMKKTRIKGNKQLQDGTVWQERQSSDTKLLIKNSISSNCPKINDQDDNGSK